MPPPATVDFRAPASRSSSDSCSFNAGSGPTHSARSKARFFKQRKSSKSSSFATTAVDSGINPFRSVNSQNVDAQNCCKDSLFDQCDRNASFVFGGVGSGEVNELEPSKLGNTGAGFRDSGINPFRLVNSQNVDADNCCKNSIFDQYDKNASFVFGVVDSGEANGLEPGKLGNIGAGFRDNGIVDSGKNASLQREESNCSDHVQYDKNASFVFGGVDSGEVNGLELGKLGNMGAGFRDNGIVDPGKNVSLQREESNCSDHVGKPQFHENHATEAAEFSFGAADKDQIGKENLRFGEIGPEAELSDGLKKLNIEHIEKGSCPVETVRVSNDTGISNDGDSFFVFESGGRNSDVSSGSSVSDEENATNLDEKREGLSAENIFLFGSSGNFTKPGASGSQSAAFSAEVDGVERDVLSSSQERNAEFSFPSSSSSVEFKLPDFDSSLSFSAILPNGLSRKGSDTRTQVSKGKKLKKPNAKLRQSKTTKKQPLQRPQSSQSVLQEDETPGCYSPMDFSPYEDTTSNNDVPLSDNQTTFQTKVKNGNSSVPYKESQSDLLFMSSEVGVASTDSSAGASSNTSGLDGIRSQFCFSSNAGSTDEKKFASTASSSSRGHASSLKRQHKKYRLKTANVSVAQGSSLASTPLLRRLRGQGVNFYVSESKGKPQTAEDKEQGCESALSVTEKACDEWRRRGNEAYEKGKFSEAEDFYTRGVNCIPPGAESVGAFRPLVRCYSNRAATRMALGRVREAIGDCLTAVELDPTFHRAQMRAANCHLLLGELEDAMQGFHKSMDSANAVCVDRQVVISASDGIQKSQKVIECTKHSSELLKLRTSEAAASALESITEAMLISLYSEKLLEMKAESLCMLGKHEEAIMLCQQSLDFAEKNFSATTYCKHEVDSSCLDVRLWRCRVTSKCSFHLGRLEVALDLLEKQEFANKTQESQDPLAVTICELLKQKSAGNTAFQSGKHAEAVDYYTSAILGSMESRPFAAICFCNRAAAHQALGQIADAIADCSLAIGLDENYAKAVSRRATLHEMIRDYKQAAADLQRLASLLEKQSREKLKQSGSGNRKELRQVQQRLSVMEEEAKRDVPLDLYLILGSKRTDPASEIKKAYRKAALRHHPDKAAQSLVRSDTGDESRAWKDIAELVHKDSDRLFKMIGEAYAVLSDPTKREEYDEADDMRKLVKESNNLRSTSWRHSEYFSQRYPFERSSNSRDWKESYYGTYSHR